MIVFKLKHSCLNVFRKCKKQLKNPLTNQKTGCAGSHGRIESQPFVNNQTNEVTKDGQQEYNLGNEFVNNR